ncbi:hypothetical protein RIF29_19225 [Crotalaria pallida]|uniref:TCP domain-containing protein n=1 Tax=Crotalaria pallida TaxID=3830 RepID=A0AAN9IB82_CROPI
MVSNSVKIGHWESNNNDSNKMTNTPKEADFPLKQEGLISIDHEKAKASSASSAQWLRLKDPRIVRVSRAFGGKDRHSKVCTIRGLRDRRVRLSVPTAIHLYDLQDRLGLNQPSKVVDWLLNAAKDEIDELPPLPIPPGNFTLGYPSLTATTSNEVISTSQNRIVRPSARDSHLIGYPEDHNKQESNNCMGAHVLPNNLLLPRPNHPSFLGLLNTMPIGNYQWEPSPSSSDVAQLGNHGSFPNQTEVHSINVVPFPSTLSLSTGNSSASQILVCPQGATTQSYFPSSSHVAAMEMDQRQINHFHQMLSSAASSHQNLLASNNSLNNPSQHLIRMTPKLFHSSNSSEIQSHNKDHDFPSE